MAAGSHQHRRCGFPGGFPDDLCLFLNYRVASTSHPTSAAAASSTCALFLVSVRSQKGIELKTSPDMETSQLTEDL
jgi:hypothetical protein